MSAVGQDFTAFGDASGGQTDRERVVVERDATVVQLTAQLVRSMML